MQHQNNKITTVPSQANLCLQILLHFNVIVSAVWLLLHAAHLCRQLSALLDFHSTLMLFGYVLALLVEGARLYAGYSGNLRGRTGDLGSFLTLTLLVQLPLLSFLLLAVQAASGILAALIGALLLFSVLEILCGLQAVRQLSKRDDVLCRLNCAAYQQRQSDADGKPVLFER